MSAVNLFGEEIQYEVVFRGKIWLSEEEVEFADGDIPTAAKTALDTAGVELISTEGDHG